MPEDHRVQPEHPGVIKHVLVRRALRAAIGRVELQGDRLGQAHRELGHRATRLVLPILIFLEVAIDLVRGREQKCGPGHHLADRLQHVQRPQRIDLKIQSRPPERGRHRDLAGQMEDGVGPVRAHGRHDIVGVPRVTVHMLLQPQSPQPFEVLARADARQVVENHDGRALSQQAGRHVAAEKSTAAGYQVF